MALQPLDIRVFDVAVAGVISHNYMVAGEDMNSAPPVVENDVVFNKRHSVIDGIRQAALGMASIVDNDSIPVSRLAAGIGNFVVDDDVHVVINDITTNEIVSTLCMIDVYGLIYRDATALPWRSPCISKDSIIFDYHIVGLLRPYATTTRVARNVVCNPHVMIALAYRDCRTKPEGVCLEARNLDITAGDLYWLVPGLNQWSPLTDNVYGLLGGSGLFDD